MQAYAVFIFLSASRPLEHSLHKHILIVFCKSWDCFLKCTFILGFKKIQKQPKTDVA